MGKSCLVVAGLALTLAWGLAQPTNRGSAQASQDSPAAANSSKAEWTKLVTVDTLTAELSYASDRIAQHLKKQTDYDRFIKDINADAHLLAILAGLVAAHPDRGAWQGVAVELQAKALEIGQAAEAKGAKNFRAATEAHAAVRGLLDKGAKGERGKAGSHGATPDWASLGELRHLMKRVDTADKQIRSGTSSESAFKKASEKLRVEAAMLATLSEIAPAFRPGEKEFEKHSGTMTTAAREVLDAAKSSDLPAARKAYTTVKSACNDCHKAYRFEQKSDF